MGIEIVKIGVRVYLYTRSAVPCSAHCQPKTKASVNTQTTPCSWSLGDESSGCTMHLRFFKTLESGRLGLEFSESSRTPCANGWRDNINRSERVNVFESLMLCNELYFRANE
jgi:hypothetical protein